jgi:hypothetical protein
MIDHDLRHLTFAQLDRTEGIADVLPASGEKYPLPAWYRTVRDVPLEKLALEDICKACRQQIHLEQVVPLALTLLESDPLAGEMYDGELLTSLNAVPRDYWSSHEAERQSLKAMIEAALSAETIADNVRQDADELFRKAASLV